MSAKILEAVKDGAMAIPEIFEILSRAGYGASLGKLKNVEREIQKEKAARQRRVTVAVKEKQRYYNLLYYLKKQGLIKEQTRNGKTTFSTTALGLSRLTQFSKKKNPLPATSYQTAKSGNLVIVAFDVPEQERYKRDWLRSALRNLGLRPLQRSVWIGSVTIPEEFLADLRRYHLVSYVQILEVRGKPSLREVL